MDEEIWMNIEGYEGYQVSNLGGVRSLDRMVKHPKGGLKTVKGKILNPATSTNGYQRVQLWKDGKQKKFMVHRLVYEAFCGEIPDGYEVNHINEDKSDNRLSNLNLMTHQENTNWGTGNERRAKALKKAQLNDPRKSKSVVGYDYEGNIVITFPSTAEAGRNGYNHGNVWACCRGKKPQYKGLIWRYANGTA